ncbi:Aldo/keto reductase family protein [Singulisphaera sp. GP187]|uniref:aldo/keto reductase n=1 Tax=Singulisphaera sp. GP187 TaxID=1882752 RepID=UPI000929D8DC|nr:aldo/keto reductase [Singulisphaera sp. GP187]SIO60490.1 Aldo/keto reductase family protein [Singulisphaera sp. GP187]
MIEPVDPHGEVASGRITGSPVPSFLVSPAQAFGRPICRLGLAARGGAALTPDDVLYALDRGVNFLNWPGESDLPGGPDAVSRAVATLGPRRESVVVSVQFGARTAAEAAEELRTILATLKTDSIDVLTFYYVEQAAEWHALAAPGGALDYCRAAQRAGVIRKIGITSHQRPLAAEIARSGQLDVLMVRYNAAHRGAEREVFPTTDHLGLPVIAYTALRWGALLRPTPDDPPTFAVPPAPSWYRFALQSPSVSVVLMAPHDRAELEQDLDVLHASEPLDPFEYSRLAEHGNRVRRHAGRFP